MKVRVWSKVNGGTSTTTEAMLDSRCTYLITMKTETVTVTDEMKVEIKH